MLRFYNKNLSNHHDAKAQKYVFYRIWSSHLEWRHGLLLPSESRAIPIKANVGISVEYGVIQVLYNAPMQWGRGDEPNAIFFRVKGALSSPRAETSFRFFKNMVLRSRRI